MAGEKTTPADPNESVTSWLITRNPVTGEIEQKPRTWKGGIKPAPPAPPAPEPAKQEPTSPTRTPYSMYPWYMNRFPNK